MDLSNLSVEDLTALQKRDYDSMSAEGLQQLQAQRQQAKQTAALAANPPLTPDSADKAASAKAPQAMSLAPRGAAQQDIQDMQQMDPDMKRGFAKMMVGTAAGGIAGPATEGMGALATAGVNAGVSGLQKYFSNLMDNKQDSTEGVGTSAAIGGGASLVGSGLSNFFSGAANGSMKRAVGLVGAASKNAPADIGNRIADQGIWGTKAGMAAQVAKKYASQEQTVQDLAQGLEGNVSGDTLATAIKDKAQQYLNPEDASKVLSGREGGVAAFDKVSNAVKTGAAGYQEGSPEVTSVRNMVGDGGDLTPTSSSTTPQVPEQQGVYGGKGLLALKRAGDAEAFNQSGQMGNTYSADAYRAQADEARSHLASLSEGAMPQALKDEQTLLYANKGLMKPDMTYKNPVSLTDIGAAMTGASSGGLPGAGTAVLASKAWVSPIVQSLFAQGAHKLGVPATKLLSDPEVIQSLFGAEHALNSR